MQQELFIIKLIKSSYQFKCKQILKKESLSTSHKESKGLID